MQSPKLSTEREEVAVPLKNRIAIENRPDEKASLPRKLWFALKTASPFGTNVALTAGANLLLGIFALATGPICARLLGPSGRGELSAMQNLYWLIGALALMGMPEATLYFTARRAHDPQRIMCSGIILALLAFPLLYVAVYFFIPVMLAAQRPSIVSTARWVLLGVPIYILWMMPVFALRGRNDLVWWNFTRIVPSVGWLLFLVFVKFLASPSPGLLAFGYIAIMAIALFPTYMVVRQRVPGQFKPATGLWPRMMRYGIPLAGAEIPLTLNLRLDQMLMAGFMPAHSLGLYVVAVAWSGVVLPILVAIGTVLFPRLAGANECDRAALLAQSVRMSVITAAALALLVAVSAPVFIPLLFGKPFSGAVPVATVLAFATAISGVNIVLEEGARGLAHTATVFWAEAAGLVLTALTLLALLPHFGIFGAGLASVLGYSGTTIILIASLHTKIGIPLRVLLIPRRDEIKELWRRLMAIKNTLHQLALRGE